MMALRQGWGDVKEGSVGNSSPLCFPPFVAGSSGVRSSHRVLQSSGASPGAWHWPGVTLQLSSVGVGVSPPHRHCRDSTRAPSVLEMGTAPGPPWQSCK